MNGSGLFHFSRATALILELVILFFALPIVYWLDILPVHKVVPLIFLLLYCMVIMLLGKRVSRQNISVVAPWKSILIRFLVLAVTVVLFVTLFTDLPALADFAADRKLLLMLVAYPIVSVIPQELIFREFFFYRYSNLVKNDVTLVVLNVALFSFAHLYFQSWIVTAFTLVGGLLFTLTYLKTRSLLVVSIEHSLYGMLVLSTGLSEHFYKPF